MKRSVGIGVLAAVATELLYGNSFVFTKIATAQVDAVTLLAWRFAVAFVVMLALAATRVIRLHISRHTLGSLLLLAVFQPIVYYLGETADVTRTTASESGLIISAIPVITVLCGWAMLGTRPSRHQVTGILTTLLGVILTVVAGGLAAHFDLAGYLYLVLAVCSYAVYAVLVERHAHTTEIDKTFVMIAVGAIGFVGLAVVRHTFTGTLPGLLATPTDHAGLWVPVLYLALGSSIGAFFLQNVAIRHLGSNRYATFIGISTLAALASGALVLHERLSPLQWGGGALILAGVYIANRVPAVRPPA